MSLITFKNLPDTTTPITAENLNNNFEYLDDKVVNVASESTTDAYSCDYINDCNTYSTNEVNTGKTWINGKPIYRKVIQLTASTTTQSFAVSTISNDIENIWIDASSSFYGNGGIISDWQITEGRFRIVIDSGNVYYICSTNAYKNGTITFEYTKTTD